jgi:hypothetical protein
MNPTYVTNVQVFNKGNNKITEHRAIFQRESQNSYVNKQTKSVNNRKTGKTQWPWLGTGISKEIVAWISVYGAKPPSSITVKAFTMTTF